MKRAALFDLDGTLLNTEEGVQYAFQQATSVVTGSFPNNAQFAAGYLRALEVNEDQIFRAFGKEVGIAEEHLFAFEEAYHAALTTWVQSDKIALMPGAERLVRHLSLHGILMAVVTNSDRESCHRKTQRFPALFGLINRILTIDDVSGGKPFGKPRPHLYWRAAERLTVRYEECLVFEDSPKGVTAGRSAGMSVVAVTNTVPREQLPGANVYIPSLEDFDPTPWELPPF